MILVHLFWPEQRKDQKMRAEKRAATSAPEGEPADAKRPDPTSPKQSAKERFNAVLLRCLASCAPEDVVFAMRTLPEARPVQLKGCLALADRPPAAGEWQAAAATLRAVAETHADPEALSAVSAAAVNAPADAAVVSGLLETLLKAGMRDATDEADADAGAARVGQLLAKLTRLLLECSASESTVALVSLTRAVFWHGGAASCAAAVLGALPPADARSAGAVEALVNVMRSHVRCGCGSECKAFSAAAEALSVLSEGDSACATAARAADAKGAIGPRRNEPQAKRLLVALGN